MEEFTIIFIHGEIPASELGSVGIPIVEIGGVDELSFLKKKYGVSPENCLALAARDASVNAFKNLGIAVAGYKNPEITGQTYWGVQMLIEGFDETDAEFFRRIFERCHGIPWTILSTERCVVRELALSDLEDLFELYGQPGISFSYDENGNKIAGPVEPLYAFDEERKYQENYISHMYHYYGYGMWLVFEKDSGALIGRAGIENRLYPEGMGMELGYVIHPKWQRRGIATEVCRAIIDYAAEKLDCHELNLLTDGGNAASVALARKLGFSYAEETDVTGSVLERYKKAL